MKFIREALDKVKPHFEKGGKWEKFFYIYEAHETLLFAPNETTKPRGVQVRDAIDMKRMMMTVIISMLPCLLFGIWNAGHQHFLATGQAADLMQEILVGATLVLPIVVVSYGVTSRVVPPAVEKAKQEGIKVGQLRLITVWPFPEKRIAQLTGQVKAWVVPEINLGQMVREVERAVGKDAAVVSVTHAGGDVPDPEDIFEAIKRANPVQVKA